MKTTRAILATCMIATSGVGGGVAGTAAATGSGSTVTACPSGAFGVGNIGGPAGGIDLGALTDYLFVFADGRSDANWQGATKGFAGDAVVDGVQASERTSGGVPYAGTISTNDSNLGAWHDIVTQNPGQATAAVGATALVADLEGDLTAALAQIDGLPATTGYASVSSTSLDGLDVQDSIDTTYVINVTSGFGVSSQIDITGDAGDVFVLRWDSDANFSDGYEGQVKFQSGGAIVPHGGLTAGNFIHVAGDINASGGGSTPPAPYPQGPRLAHGTGALISGGSDFSGGGFFTGYWLTTGKPDDKAETASLSNAIFVGGWYSLTKKFSMTSGTSGVHVCPNAVTPESVVVGNYVWVDDNHDGLQNEAPSRGVNGVTVVVSDASGRSVTDITGAAVGPTVTADDASGNPGYYLFDDLPPGAYRITFSDLPVGYEATLTDVGSDDAIDSDGPTATTPLLAAYTSDLTIDLGLHLIPAGSLGDRVWSDMDADGIQDAGEPGIPGVTVDLFDADGTLVGSDVTDAAGVYLFDGLAAGTYRVVFATVPGFVPSPSNTGTNDAIDSDPIDGAVYETLAAGETNLTIDAGFVPLASLGDFVWSDVNGNGIQDLGEAGLPGVAVTLDPNTPSDPSDDAVTTTDSGGAYLFDGLRPGTYRVTFTSPAGHVPSPSNVGGDDAVDSDPVGGVVVEVIVAGEHNPTIDAGFVALASLGDFVWADLDGDGVQDAGESGVPGVTVQLLDGAGDPVAGTSTGDDGRYHFTDLPPGAYRLRFIAPSGSVLSPRDRGGDDAVDSDPDPSTGVTAPTTLSAGENDPTIDAGLVVLASLGDYVWSDVDSNGIQDPTEPGRPGVTVELLDADTGGTIATTTTDADGRYLFDGLWPGDYQVRFVAPAETVFAPRDRGGDDGLDSDADPVTGTSAPVVLRSGGDDRTIDAGLIPVGSVGDTVFADIDGDGAQDAGEPGLPGVTVELRTSSGSLLSSAVTDPDGHYLFEGLPAGGFVVVVLTATLPDGYDAGINSADPDGGHDSTSALVLPAGASDLDQDFGYFLPAALGDFVWSDLDADGHQDEGEPGIVGVTIVLRDADGATIASAVTDDDGRYWFDGLIAGRYEVAFATPDGYAPSPSDVGDDTADSDPVGGVVSVALAPGDEDPTIDAGFVQLASIAGNVSEDLDDDDLGDVPLGDVTVLLYIDADGDGTPDGPAIATSVTAPDGSYSFDDLVPGDYVVSETNPAGYVDVSAGDTTGDGDPYDGYVFSNHVPVTLVAGETDTGNDFVDRLPASIMIVKTAGRSVGDQAPDRVVHTATGSVGERITYVFEVTNTGVATLTAVELTDPLDGLSVITCDAAPNGSIVLLPGATTICTATYRLSQRDIDAGIVLNVATVEAERPRGNPADPTDDVSDSDPAVVDVPQIAAVSIAKSTNGVDHDSVPGAMVAVGSAVTWTYEVTNPGNVALASVVVVDDAGTPGDTSDDFTPTFAGGDTDGDDLLDVTETWIYSAVGTAVAGQYVNRATVHGTPVDEDGNDVLDLDDPSDEDDDAYFGVAASIDIQKTVVLGTDGSCPGHESVHGPAGTPVTYCFEVTNTGNVRLDEVVVEDATVGLAPTVVAATLPPSGSASFSFASSIRGDLVNTASATGTPVDTQTDPGAPTPFEPDVVPSPTDSDTASVDETPTLTVSKTNDADGDGTYSDVENAQSASSTVPFRVVISNLGGDAIRFVSIADSVGSSPRAMDHLSCAPAVGGLIPAGGSAVCTFTAPVDLTTARAETDVVTVTATDPDGTDPVTRTDDSTVLAEADLTITKSFSTAVDDNGDGVYTVVYSIAVSNVGTTTDTYDLSDDPRFDDELVVLSGAAVTATSGSHLPPAVPAFTPPQWSLAAGQPIAPGETHTYTLSFEVDATGVLPGQSVVDPCALSNQATVTVDGAETRAEACGDIELPDIGISKEISAGPTERPAQPGVYDVRYTITVVNDGTGPGRYDLVDDLRFGEGVTVLDASVVSADVPSDLSGWTGGGQIVAGQWIDAATSDVYTVSVVAELDAATLPTARDCGLADGENGTGLLNVAAVSGPLVAPAEAEACAPLPEPSIDVTKTVSSGPTLHSGSTYDIAYRIVVTNSGGGLGEYDLEDSFEFGDGVTVVSAAIASSDVDLSATTWNGSSTTVVVTGVALPGGSAHTFDVTVRATVAPDSSPAARDCVVGEGEDGTGLLNVVSVTVPGVAAPATDTACGSLGDPSLRVTKSVTSGPTLTTDGTYSISYRVVVDNVGDGPGTYTLVDRPGFGPAISIVSATVTSADVTLPGPQTWNPAGGVYTVAAGLSIAPGGSQRFTMTFVTRIDAAELDRTAATCLGAHQPGESEYFNRAEVLVDLQVVDFDDACATPPVPKLTISKSVSPTVLSPRADGRYDVTYTITVRNTGAGPTTYTLNDSFAFADGVQVLDVRVTRKPSGAQLVAGFNGANKATIAQAAIGANGVHTYDVAVRVDVSGVRSPASFDCTLDRGESGTGLLNRATLPPTASACVPIPKFADLVLTKAVDQESVAVGSNVTFTIYVTNTGPVDATGVTVKDVLPDGLTYVSQRGDGSYDPRTGIWTIGHIGFSQAATLDLEVRVDRAGTFVNTAQVWASAIADPDSVPGNNVSSEDDQDIATVRGTPAVVVLPPTPPPATLPATGSGTRSQVTVAAWLMLVGVGLVLGVSRRRERAAPRSTRASVGRV
jgi:uncharacterized repeat protein (TIGR01451 family)